jgi:hypothetical protein
MDANPELQSNADKISVGQIISIPGAGPDNRSAAPPPKPAPVAQGGWVLGELSEKYETGGRGSATVSTGQGDSGGVSYGSFQLTSQPNGGSVAKFVAQADFQWREDFTGLQPGSAAFSAKWEDIATRFPDAFKAAGRDYIKNNYFVPLSANINRDDGIDVTQRSHTFQDVIWSRAIQMGASTPAIHRAFAQMQAAGTFNPAGATFDHDAIIAIYKESGRKDQDDVMVYFSKNSPSVQKGVAKRFEDECALALKTLTQNA